MEKREFDFFELIRLIIRNRKFIIIFVAVVSVAAVIYSLVTPQIWRSTATFYVIGDQTSSLPFNIEGLSGLTAGLMGTTNSQNAISAVIAMNSRQFSEKVIRHFNLIDYYKITTQDSLKAMDSALRMLHTKTMKIGSDPETGLVTVSADTKDKKLSRDIVNYYLQQLDIYNREEKITRGKMNREFLEARVNETRAEIDSLLLALKDFQQRHNTVDIEAQTSSLIKSYSDIIATKMSTDIELELARKNYAENSPIVLELKDRSEALAKQIRQLEAGKEPLKPRYLIDIGSLPDLATQYAQLKMNLEIKSKVYEFLYPQYEAAKLEELKDLPTLDILDTPREAGLRVRPKRAVMCIIAFALAVVASIIIVLIKNALELNKERWQEIKKEL